MLRLLTHLLHIAAMLRHGQIPARRAMLLLGVGLGLSLQTTVSGATEPSPAARAVPGSAAGLINPAPTAQDWADLAKLPDFSGVWYPSIRDQEKQETANPPPWNARVTRLTEALAREADAGRPKGLFVNCLPEGMPSWMLISHNALEILFTPGRVTLLGESDGNRLRRIYTDGRLHPTDPDPTFHGHSIGHWEADTLVVDTVGVLPEVYLAISEAVGVPNNGNLHVVERLHLADKDTLHDELEIMAPEILVRPWKTTRIFFRHRARKFDIVEGVCREGDFRHERDAAGNAVMVPARTTGDGNVLPQAH